MVRGLMHSLQGTVQLEMKGFSPERFLNLCSRIFGKYGLLRESPVLG